MRLSKGKKSCTKSIRRKTKEILHEKHPPKDDVCLFDLGPQGFLHVDQSVFDRVNMGDHLRKERWTQTLECNQRKIELAWSADTRGMIRAMPLALGVMLILAVWICRTDVIS
jgi:hypothetical protein